MMKRLSATDQNFQALTDLPDPTSAQDAATKAYVDANVGGSGSGANTALSNLASVAINTSLISDTNLTDDLGSTSAYWANTYSQAVNLNSTASLSGSTAGVIAVTGNVDIPVTTSTTGQVTQGGSTLVHTYTRPDRTFNNLYVGTGAGNLTSATTGANYTGTANVGVGTNTLSSVTTGYYNQAIGTNAGASITSGFNNFMAGHQPGLALTTGHDNFLMGRESGLAMTTGSSNIGIGYRTLQAVKTTSSNVAIGYQAGYSTTGSSSVFIGNQAGANETGSNKLYIANSNTATPLIGGDFSAQTLTFNVTKLNVSTLPTSATGLSTGDVWNNGGVLNVV